MSIRIGVAGWDYADWHGPVYPATVGDRLRFVARFVDAIEINSTFYRHVRPAVAESWVRRTEDRARLRFTAKAHRGWTHETGPLDPEGVRRGLDGLAPLRDAGRLGAVLLQFPQSFHRTPERLDRLERLLRHLEGWPRVVELRHASWSDESCIEWLRDRRAGWCAVDQPRPSPASLPLLARVAGEPAYVRLHGRNVRDWFRPDAGRDARYDYLYSAAELDALVPTVRAMADPAVGGAEELFVIQNNHFRGQALVNALQLKRLITGEPPPAPDTLVAAYPELADRVEVERQGLF